MAKRTYKPPSSVLAIPETTSALPTNRPIAVYYRQSTNEQIGNISTSIQTIDMVAYLKQRGWQRDDILMIDMDAGVSGTKKIDERPGMRTLFDLITDGTIGAVACQDEDRLFRDVTQIQVNIFIEACRSANVQVLTPSIVYDFANPLTGTFHARQFRFKSEMAAEYISSVILGKLHRAKQRMHLEGRWSGAAIAPGYMVDMRKALPNGNKNENWRRFVPFEPYTEIVQEYFRLFLSYAGNLTATLRHIHNHGPYYPDPETCRPPEGYFARYQICRYGGGYCPKKEGLAALLTNAAYIGHWTYHGAVVRWNNHPPIVSEKIFMQAFHYLMEYTLDGTPNPYYKPFRQNARPSQEVDRPVGRPLCAGLMVAQLDGGWRNVGTNWAEDRQQYKYVLWSNDPINDYVWGREAGRIDAAVGALLRNKLADTFDNDGWQNTLDTYVETNSADRKSKLAQITTLERVMENLITSLETLSTPDMIAGAERRYAAAQAEYARYQSELATLNAETQHLDALTELRHNYLPTLENWEYLDHEEKRIVFHTFIRRIEATHLKQKGLELLIYWVDGSNDTLTVTRKAPTGTTWLPTETDQLLQLADNCASQVEICQTFPNRTWAMIQHKLYRTRGCPVAVTGHEVKQNETYIDYLKRLEEQALLAARPAEHWTEAHEHRLRLLINQHASELEIAAAFPRRKWGCIRKKIKRLTGDTFYVKRSGTLHHNETYVMYRQRMGDQHHAPIGSDGSLSISSHEPSPAASPT